MHCQQWTMSQNMGSMDAVFSSSVPRPQVEPLCPSTLIETRRPLPERKVSIPCNFAWEVLRVPFENLHRLYQEIKVFNVWCPEKKKRHWAFLEGDILRGEGLQEFCVVKIDSIKWKLSVLPHCLIASCSPKTILSMTAMTAAHFCRSRSQLGKKGMWDGWDGQVCLMLGVIVVHVPFLYQSWWDGQVYSACGF